jgi:hypothetical protein
MSRFARLSAVISSISAFAGIAFTACDPKPSITVEPSTNLNAIHRVTVSGTASLFAYVEIYQCVAGQAGTCRRVGNASTGGTGNFSTSLDVQQTYEGGACDGPGKCELALYISGVRQESAPLSFEPVGALALGTIEAPASVTAGESLPIVGRSWASNTAVRIGVIRAAYSSTRDYRIAGASGSFTDALTIRGFLVSDLAPALFPPGAGFKDLRDCVSTSGSCVLVAHDFRAFSPTIRVPLTVQQGAIATGTATIEQSMPLPYQPNTATPVFVQGSGWATNRALEVYQCASHLGLCIAMPAVTTDAAGAFRAQRSVYYGAAHGSPESGLTFTCGQPGSCVVVVADDRAGLDAAARIPMHFAPPGGG